MIECLKEQKKHLSQRCHQKIFRLQEVEMTDPELDYQLMRVCKQMIKVRRREEGGGRRRRRCFKMSAAVINNKTTPYPVSFVPLSCRGSVLTRTPGTSFSV